MKTLRLFAIKPGMSLDEVETNMFSAARHYLEQRDFWATVEPEMIDPEFALAVADQMLTAIDAYFFARNPQEVTQ
jgi:hypothetical protein